jgi:hypothetical protein
MAVATEPGDRACSPRGHVRADGGGLGPALLSTGPHGTVDGRSAMDGRTWIGIDLGTQSVRALAVGDDGALRAAATRPLRSHHPASPDGDVRHEQDPGDWTRAVDAVLAEVAGGSTRRASGVSRWTPRRAPSS